jgi:hypothetical protein
MSAALWRGLVKWRTAEAIDVSTRRRCRSLAADDPSNGLGRPVAVRDRRAFKRWDYHGIPTVPTPRIVLDLAAIGDVELVRFVLASMDFMRILNERVLLGLCGRGVPGSAVLRSPASPSMRSGAIGSWSSRSTARVTTAPGGNASSTSRMSSRCAKPDVS